MVETERMSRDEPPDQKSFDRLLAWLDPDREQAATELEKIRSRLEYMFARRPRCHIPEELAYKVIWRVARRLPEVEATYVGNKALYFYGFVKNVYLEYLRTLEPPPPPPPAPEPIPEPTYDCLEKCLNQLTAEERQLLERYYTDSGKAKIENRKALANELGVNLNTLRTRAHRLKTIVGKCLFSCLEGSDE
jgi:DNA-directed RNA polymerase specialized sigma24 family protein